MVLEVQDLRLVINGKSIINGLTVHVNKGEIHGVLGENGTGKTTIAYLIMGVNDYKPTSGRIIFEGQDIADLSVTQRAKNQLGLKG